MEPVGREKRVVSVLLCALAIILVVSVVMILKMQTEETRAYKAEIYLDGELVETVDFVGLREERRIEVADKNVVMIDKDGVYMLSADCPDKLCVKQGRVIKPGQSIVCLPNRVSVKLIGKDNADVDIVVG